MQVQEPHQATINRTEQTLLIAEVRAAAVLQKVTELPLRRDQVIVLRREEVVAEVVTVAAEAVTAEVADHHIQEVQAEEVAEAQDPEVHLQEEGDKE
jgi:hypothetical protein